MDPITAQELRAMKSSSKKMRNGSFQFFCNLILHLLVASACALLCSYPLWLPSVKRLIFTSLPRAISHVLSPSCLFVAVNVIVVALIGESRLGGSKEQFLQAREIYDEYVRTSERGVGRHPADAMRSKELEVGGEPVHGVIDEEKKMSKDTVKELELGFKSEIIDCGNDEREEEVEEEEEEEEELLNEELNRRIEDFIVRVNRQRWLEA